MRITGVGDSAVFSVFFVSKNRGFDENCPPDVHDTVNPRLRVQGFGFRVSGLGFRA